MQNLDQITVQINILIISGGIMILYRFISVGLVAVFMLACTNDEPAKLGRDKKQAVVETQKQPIAKTKPLAPPEPCESGQESFTSGYQNFPDQQCSSVASQVAGFDKRVGFRKKCQQQTGASKRPKTVARVQVNECGDLKQKEGVYASMLVCCDAPVTEAPPPVFAYDVELDCPETQRKAMASKLHYPGISCDEAVVSAESILGNSHYQRACAQAAGNSDTRQSVLDAAVFTCRQDAGAVVDVVLCCSSILPTNAARSPVKVADDIWQVIEVYDLFSLQLLLSRYPERAKARGQDGMTPLHKAVMQRNEEMARIILKAGVEINAATDSGDTALTFASSQSMAELLISHRAQVNGTGQAGPLHAAAFYNRPEVAQLLIQHGADIEQTDANGETPLHRAVFRRHIEIVSLLIQKGAAVNAISASGRTPVDMTDDKIIGQLLARHGGKSGKLLIEGN